MLWFVISSFRLIEAVYEKLFCKDQESLAECLVGIIVEYIGAGVMN